MPRFVARSDILDRSLPRFDCFWILPPILIEVSNLVARLIAPRPTPLGKLLPDAKEIKLVRQLEPLHAGRQSSNRFIVAQRVQRERPRFVFSNAFCIFGLRTVLCETTEPAVLSHRLDTELAAEKLREREQHFVATIRVQLHRLSQHPSPTFAIGFRVFVAFRNSVKNRIAISIDRCPLRLLTAPPEVSLFVIGERRKVSQCLELPGLSLPVFGQ